MQMSGRYEPLTAALRAAGERRQFVVELTLDDDAQLVGGLPDSARRLRQWWAKQQPGAGETMGGRRLPPGAG